jgi:hypothetical protein
MLWGAEPLYSRPEFWMSLSQFFYCPVKMLAIRIAQTLGIYVHPNSIPGHQQKRLWVIPVVVMHDKFP